MNVLVIDIGGTHVKLAVNGAEPRRFDTPHRMTPDQLVEQIRQQSRDWEFEAVSLGYPGLVGHNGLKAEPENLGDGWVGYDFTRAFGVPVKVLNYAAMQALGSYDGGRMLFLGLGTAVGSALVADKVIVPLELGQLPFRQASLVHALGREAFNRDKDEWLRAIHQAVPSLRGAFAADYVVLGGGNAKEVDPLPDGARRGGNENAVVGGFRLWEGEVLHAKHAPAPEVWRIVS